jgi:inositol transporter-like SP family MFS transporter
MASYIDAVAIITWSVALVIYQDVFGLDPAAIGVLSGVLTASIALGSIIGGRLGDRYGRRSVFVVTMAAIIAGAVCMIFATTLPFMVIGTVLVGLATGADLPVSLSTISEAAPDKSRGRMIGFSQVLWIFGSLVPGFMAAAVGGLGQLGGQILFIHLAAVSAIVLIARLTIPESALWLRSREERRGGVATIRADRASVGALVRAPYVVPFVALLVFFGLFTAGGNALGQFSTYLLVNAGGVPIQMAAVVGIIAVPAALGGAFAFMKVVSGRRRFAWFKVGAILVVLGLAIPAVAGLSMVTYLVTLVLTAFGGAFCSDSIMKFWTQRSFPTLIRTTAQGAIIAVARFAAAAFAFVAPLVIDVSANVFFAVVATLSAAGLLVGWAVFRTRDAHDEFAVEDEADVVPQKQAVAGR